MTTKSVRISGIESSLHQHWLILPGENGFEPTGLDGFAGAGEVDLVDPLCGLRRTGVHVDEVKRLLTGADRPYLVTVKRG